MVTRRVINGSSHAPVKLTGKKILLQQNKMAAEGGFFCTVRRRRNYQERPKLSDMADTDIIERFRLSRRRIN